MFFDIDPLDKDFFPKKVVNSRGKQRVPGSKPLSQALKSNDPVFLDFLSKCLEWDPTKRIKPDEAMKHPWFNECFEKAQQ